MPDQTINGKPTSVGHEVHYVANDGKKHDATIKSLTSDHADIETHVNGEHKIFTNVPHSTSGFPHTWDHTADHAKQVKS